MFQSTSQSKFVRGNRFQSRVPWAQGSSRAGHPEAGIRGHHSASATPARCVGRDTALGAQVCWQRHGPGGYPWAPHLKFQSTAKSRLDTAAAPWRGRRGVCSWSNPQNQLGILLARVQGERVYLFCFVQRSHSQLSEARKRIGAAQSTPFAVFVYF